MYFCKYFSRIHEGEIQEMGVNRPEPSCRGGSEEELQFFIDNSNHPASQWPESSVLRCKAQNPMALQADSIGVFQ